MHHFSTKRNIFYYVVFALSFSLSSCEELPIDPFANASPRERPVVVVVDNYEKYGYVTSADRTLLLNEGFDNNNRKWKTSGTYYYRPYYLAANGYLTMANEPGYLGNSSSLAPYVNTIDFPELTGTGNFEIEASMQTDTRYSGYNDLLIWGASATTPQKRLCWANSYFLSYVAIRNDNGLVVNEKTYSVGKDKIYQGEFNKITIRQVKNTCYYFLNEVLVAKQPASSFYGTQIGFQVGSNSWMEVDYLRVNRLVIK